jgi:hypothetical protein
VNEETHNAEQPDGQGQPPGNAPAPSPPISTPPPVGAAQGGEDNNGSHGRQETRRQYDPAKNPFWHVTFPNYTMAAFTGGIFFATCAYIVVTHSQLHEMNNQLWEQKHEARATSAQLNRQLSKINAQVSAEETTAAAAESAADTAVSTLNESRAANIEQLAALTKSINEQNRMATATEKGTTTSARALADHEDEQRANVRMIGSVNYSSGTLSVGVQFRNIGQTAGRQVRATFAFSGYPRNNRSTVSERQDAAFNNALKERAQTVAFLGAGDTISPAFSIPNVPDGVWEYLKQTPGGWVLAARVTYADIYGRSHWTNFCTYQVGHDQAQYCASHNDQGDFPSVHKPSGRSPKKTR